MALGKLFRTTVFKISLAYLAVSAIGAGLVQTAYQPPGDTGGKHRALARNFVLAGGFHLLVGHDLAEVESLRHILGEALLTSLLWLVVIGTLGGLWVARRVLNRVDAINA